MGSSGPSPTGVSDLDRRAYLLPKMRRIETALWLLLAAAPAGAEEILTFPTADLVLGQADFTSSIETDPPTGTSLSDLGDIIRDPISGKVFVADADNNRVLRYRNPATLANGGAAEFAFGQSNLTSRVSGTSQTANSGPIGLAIDSSGRLWVSDPDNSRILRFNAAISTTTSPPAATVVLGQSNFTSGASSTPPTAASLNGPCGLHLDAAGRLWVADTGNHRILRYDNADGLASGASASAVLGQASFADSAPGNDASSLNTPLDLTVDASGTLWVADTGNHRIVGYPLAATLANGSPATRVLGQGDFATFAAGRSASRLDSPNGVFADGNSLWVLDSANHRALRFFPLDRLGNGAAAMTVVGQPDFTTAAESIVDARHFSSPFLGIFVDADGALWVSDSNARRLLRFDPEVSARPRITVRGRGRFSTRKRSLTIRGTAFADTSLASVRVVFGKSRRPVAGLERWSTKGNLKPGRNVILATASDALGKTSKSVRLLVTKE